MFDGAAILTYHSVDDSGSVLSIVPEVFARQMELLAECGVAVVRLNEVTKVRPALALTFDDGYANFESEVVPLLERYGVPATVFVVSRYCGGVNTWCRAPLPALQMMSWEALRSLPAKLVTAGAHTATHVDLTRISAAQAEEEIDTSRREIEERMGRGVPFFAYPYGASNAAVRRMVSERFELACGTRLSTLSAKEDPFELSRIDTYYLRETGRFEQFVAGHAEGYLRLRGALRALHEYTT